MRLLEKRFNSIGDAKIYLDSLVEANKIYSYEICPSYDEYYFDVYITPIIPTIEIIEVTVVGASYKQYIIG